MKCPQCAAALSSVVYEGVPIHTCESCGGEFVGGGELARIVQTEQQQFGQELHAAAAHHKPTFGHTGSEPDRSLKCPICAQTMKVINYGGDSCIFTDRCDACGGLWLDREELEKVQILMERWAQEAQPRLQAIAGELEQARRKAAESTSGAFSGSRFSFVNALINRLLDAA